MANAGHYVMGAAGLALLRRWLVADDAELGRRVHELSEFGAKPNDGPLALRFEVTALDVDRGYARWSEVYDNGQNPLIQIEEPAVRALLEACPAGDALDAACGTGRHAELLAARGHRVIGVDQSPEMLERARARVPGAELRKGTLDALPVADASVDVAVCALALTHLPELTAPVRELARVLRPGAALIVSDLHPLMTLLGGTGLFMDKAGAGNVRTYHHPLGAYLAAFRGAGLDVLDCLEPAIEEQHLKAVSGGLNGFAAEAFQHAFVGLPQALVWRVARAA